MKTLLLRSTLAVTTFLFGYTLVSAQNAGVTAVTGGFANFGTAVNSFTDNIVTALGGLFMTGAVVVFFMGIVQYIWGLREGNADKVSKGNQFMLWGLVALFVMFSVYGIVKLVQTILLPGQDNTTITIPKLRFDGAAGGGGGGGGCTPNTPCASVTGGAIDGMCSSGGTCIKN